MQLAHKHTSENVVEFSDVSFSYAEGKSAVEGLSFTIAKGDYVGIIGPNGGGKTTTLKLLLGVLKPSQGSVKIFGQEVSKVRYERAHIGYVPQRLLQEEASFPITVREIVATGRVAGWRFLGRETEADKHAIGKALVTTDMLSLEKARISELSGGQRQRAFIARALAGEPEVLVLDEPTVGVDQVSEELFYSLLKKLNQELELTVVLVSHDIDVVHKEVKKLICVNRKLVFSGDANKALESLDFQQMYGNSVVPAFHGH